MLFKKSFMQSVTEWGHQAGGIIREAPVVHLAIECRVQTTVDLAGRASGWRAARCR